MDPISPLPPSPVPTPGIAGIAAPNFNLTPEQLAQYTTAVHRGKKIRSAIRVATTDAWISAVFAGAAILMSCGGWENLVVGLMLAWVAFHSFRGVRKLRQLDPQGATDLALNQLVLGASLIAYFSYALWQTSRGNSAIVKAIAGNGDYKAMGLGDIGADLDSIGPMVIAAMRIAYATLIFATILFQGLTAYYYRTRRPYFETYLRETPKWITDLQAVTAGKRFPAPGTRVGARK